MGIISFYSKQGFLLLLREEGEVSKLPTRGGRLCTMYSQGTPQRSGESPGCTLIRARSSIPDFRKTIPETLYNL